MTLNQSSPTPDATTTNKGKVQLAGDLGGTAALPSVLKISGVTITGTPTSGQAIIATSGTAAAWTTLGGGSGTVTSVSVVTANGVSGSVATATTTPAITLGLGAITPTSVNGATATEVGYLSGVTSGIQAQLNAKGSGTVTNTGGTLTANSVVLGAGTNDAKVSTGMTTNGNSTLLLGVVGVTAGILNLTNATSGSVQITPATGALGGSTWTLSGTTDTFVGKATTDVLTNKDLTSGTNTFPTFNQNTTGSAAKWTTARTLAGNSVDGSANVAFANKLIVQGTVDAGLSGAQFLGALGTGIVKNTTTTGVLSIAIAADFPTLNQSTTGNAATVTTNANLTGPITSTGNATAITSQTGTGTKFVVDTTPTLVTPILGVATATSINKVTIAAPTTNATLSLIQGSTLATAGAFSTTLTSTATTNVTLPITGTLATLAGVEVLTNKDLTSTTNTFPSGFTFQTVATNFPSVATGTTTIPFDDTIPQITEGTEFMTQAITPKSTTNILNIEVTIFTSASIATNITAALFQDATANALAVIGHYQTTATGLLALKLQYTMTAGTTSATTFRIRIGTDSAGTLTFNGQGGARLYGAIAKSSIKITETKA